jgi:hypothetical protein
MGLGLPRFIKTGQFGDGREVACAAYVEANARRGDLDDVLATIDKFAREKSILVNVGDEKGELLDAAVRRANPGITLELGTYCGYSSMRIARAAPSAKVYSVELWPPMPKWRSASGRMRVSMTDHLRGTPIDTPRPGARVGLPRRLAVRDLLREPPRLLADEADQRRPRRKPDEPQTGCGG